MPHILLAGIVDAKPESQNFPKDGRPRTEIRIRAEDTDRAAVFLVRGYDEQADELGLLMPGDSVAVAGRLELESKDNKVVGILVIARQTVPLVRRSPNRFGGISHAAS